MPTPDRGPLRYGLGRAVLISVLCTVLYLAVLVGVWGFVSLLTGIDVVPEPGIPILAGPIMAAVACIVLLLSVLFSLRRITGRPPVARAVVAGALVYLIVPLAGAAVLTLDAADPVAGLLFAAEMATGAFVPAAAIAAAVLVAAVPPVLALGDRSR